MGHGERDWTRAELEELFEGQTVLATNESAERAQAPEFLVDDERISHMTWAERAASLGASDRLEMVRVWRAAITSPGAVQRATVRRKSGEGWVAQELVALSLLDDPAVGAVLIGFRTAGPCDAPAPAVPTPDLVGPEGTRVGRPVWLLQELSPVGIVQRSDGDVERMFGRTADGLVGQQILDFIHPDDHSAGLELWTSMLMDPGTLHTLRQRIVRPDGSLCWIESNVINRLDDEQHGSVLSICHDITERRAVERALHARATVDELTGLLNRSATVERIKDLLEVGTATVGFVDLDNFKCVNDHHGHQVGDAVLLAVAQRLLGAAASFASVGRWGGDEFLVVAPGDAVNQVTAAVDRLIADPVEVRGLVWWPSASLGVVAGEQGADPTNLIRDADRLMYAMKVARQKGRDA